MKAFFLVGLLVFAAGCTAKQSSVEDVPPRIEKPEIKALSFGVDYGVMKPEVISVLLWPKTWTEIETEDRVYTINKNSLYFDQLIVEKMLLGPQIQAAFTQFTADQCIVKFRKPAADGAPVLRDPAEYGEKDEVEWMDASAVVETERAAYDACLANVALRVLKHQRDDEIIHGIPDENGSSTPACPAEFGPKQDALIDVTKPKNLPFVSAIIDCALGAENKVAVGNEGSAVRISAAPSGVGRVVDVSFGNFNGAGEHMIQGVMKASDLKKFADLQASLPQLIAAAGSLSGDELTKKTAEVATAQEALKRYAKFIHHATIDADARHLQYSVPDMGSDLVAVSSVEYRYTKQFVFDLYRVDNLAPSMPTRDDAGAVVSMTDIAKFKGDVSVQENGVEIRKGSGQLMGPFTGVPRL